jgi:hypothetical protein
MKMSDTIGELATALAKAQGQIDAAAKGSVNPHFKSRYADLNSLREAIREPLALNDLSVLQLPRMNDKEVEVETMLIHKSGEFIAETLRMPLGQFTPQAIGSALTYCRRYSLSSILNLAADDDDGNAATVAAPAPVKAVASPELFTAGTKAAASGQQKLTEWWNTLSEADRNSLNSTQRAELKKTASVVDAKSKTENK